MDKASDFGSEDWGFKSLRGWEFPADFEKRDRDFLKGAASPNPYFNGVYWREMHFLLERKQT